MKQFIVAVDFDGTICKHVFPEIGEEVPGAFKWLLTYKRSGCKIILWTVRSNNKNRNYLDEAITFCKDRGLIFDEINFNSEQKKFSTSPKVYANVYIDDAAFGCPVIDEIPSIPDTMIERPYKYYADWNVIGPEVSKKIIDYYKREGK
jgi:hypothetical protein